MKKLKPKHCRVRKDILKKKLSVPIGNEYYGEAEPLEYRWVNDVEFEVWYKDKWQSALSIDFDY